ncbi:hypothetical protein JWS13_00270 (plasmid) [Rhodococcus pseudokoreensis]|uniref:CRISPR type IV/AFERR-associated protein Csf3 n=2 Tax=Nocardiaceae TaxID=85025 RepID=A0A974VXS5_9NOCA|nr:hypothetical protein [Rhodococcus pseudokoreensis]QSE87182.1 hypothetical protein JWS13_00270 [Rhodococcus pseudokoreensis]
MRPLLVRAHLAHGLAHGSPWATSLDGLLAAELWDEHKSQERSCGREVPRLDPSISPPDLDLPLARCELAGSDSWHWAATCAHSDIPVDRPTVRYWTARPDHTALGDLVQTLPASISERQGPYRARIMPLLATTTASVCWQGIGDIDAIRSILEPVVAIGKKRSQGEGHVLRWEFATLDIDGCAAAHLYPDGSLGRTTPAACLSKIDIPQTGGFGTAGLRPPYMHPLRKRPLHLPRQ